jgi:hypothetical protein
MREVYGTGRRRGNRGREMFAVGLMSSIFGYFSKNLILVEILCGAINLSDRKQVEP